MSGGLVEYLESRQMLTAATSALPRLAQALDGCPSDDLPDLMGLAGHLVAQAEALLVTVTREAMTRGVVAASEAACPADWVATHAGAGTSHRDALAVARVAATATLPGHEVLHDSLRQGRIRVAIGDVVLREHSRLRPMIPATMHQDVLAALVTLAEAGHGPAQLARFRDRIIGRYAPEGSLSRRQERLHTRRGMSSFGQDLHGMYHAVVCLDPASHAVIAPVLEALSAPVTTTDTHGQPVRDDRAPDQRRLDALVEVCATYQALGPKTRLGVATRLVLTMPLTCSPAPGTP